jgi:hypothetical protein
MREGIGPVIQTRIQFVNSKGPYSGQTLLGSKFENASISKFSGNRGDLIDLDEASATAEQRFCLRLRLGMDFRRINYQVTRQPVREWTPVPM